MTCKVRRWWNWWGWRGHFGYCPCRFEIPVRGCLNCVDCGQTVRFP